MTFRFADPWMLALIALAVLIAFRRDRRGGALFAPFPLASALPLSRGPLAFRWLLATGLTCLAIAAARPQYGRSIVEHQQEGRDLMLVIDTSLSMQMNDIADDHGNRSDRMGAVFDAAKRFIGMRPDDRIGLVFFASTAVTSCPLTYDHQTALDFLERTEKQQRQRWSYRQGRHESGFVGDGTNLGLGLGYAIKGLSNPNQRGRAIVLITDGADSRELPNWVDPLIAAKHASDIGIRIYGIGVGDPHGSMSQEDAFGRVMTMPTPQRLLPDMDRLAAIVALASGMSFPANDRHGLLEVLKQIDRLEPTPHEVRTRDDFTDRYAIPLALGTALIGLVLLLEPRLRGLS